MSTKEIVEGIVKKSVEERWAYTKTFNELKNAGVIHYETKVDVLSSTYYWNGGSYTTEEDNDMDDFVINPTFNGDAVKAAIEHHNKNRTPFVDFLKDIAEAGVAYYTVDMSNATLVYTSGREKEQIVEKVPV